MQMQLEMRIRRRVVSFEDPERPRRVAECHISPRDGRRVVQGGVKGVDERERTGEQRIRSPSIPRLERDLRQADPSGNLVRPFPDADRRAEIFRRANRVAEIQLGEAELLTSEKVSRLDAQIAVGPSARAVELVHPVVVLGEETQCQTMRRVDVDGAPPRRDGACRLEAVVPREGFVMAGVGVVRVVRDGLPVGQQLVASRARLDLALGEPTGDPHERARAVRLERALARIAQRGQHTIGGNVREVVAPQFHLLQRAREACPPFREV